MANRDRISQLPDHVLHCILCKLPMEEMVRTAVLSSRWRRCWTTSPVLHFKPRSPKIVGASAFDKYRDTVDSCLRLCASTPSFQSLHLNFNCAYGNPRDIISAANRWARFACERSVQELCFQRGFLSSPLPLPDDVFQFRNPLSVLDLNCCLVPHVPSGLGGLRALKELRMAFVRIGDSQLQALLTGCSQLESLTLNDMPAPVVIRSSSLRSLTVYNSLGTAVELGFAPELRELRYKGLISKFCIGAGAAPWPLLKLATIHSDEDEIDLYENDEENDDDGEIDLYETDEEKDDDDGGFSQPSAYIRFMSFLANIKILTANSRVLQVVYSYYCTTNGEPPLLFRNLVELHWDSDDHEIGTYLDALVFTLGCCPCLERLCLRRMPLQSRRLSTMEQFFCSVTTMEQYCGGGRIWSAGDGVGVGGELRRLKDFAVDEFVGEEGEMKLVAWVLAKATSLVRAEFVYRDETKVNSSVREAVALLPRASSHANVRSHLSKSQGQKPWGLHEDH